MTAGTLFTSSDLAELDDMTNSAMPDTAEVLRKVSTSDSAGGQTDVWTTIATVPCRIATLTRRLPGEQLIAERLTSVELWLIVLPPNTDVLPEDRLQVGTALYEVKGLTSAGSWQIETRVIVDQVR